MSIEMGMNQASQISDLNKSLKSTVKITNSLNKSASHLNKQINSIIDKTKESTTKADKDYQKSFKKYKKDTNKKLTDIKNFYKEDKKYRDKTNKDITNQFKDIEDSIDDVADASKDVFDDIDKASKKTFDNMEDRVGSIAQALTNMSLAFNVGEIKNGLESAVDSFVETSRDMKKHVNWNADTWKDYSKSISKAVSASNYQISRTEMNEIGSQLVVDLGMDNLDELQTYIKDLSNIQYISGTQVQDLANIVKMDRSTGANGAMVKQLADIAVSLDNNGLNTSSNDVLTSLNESIDNFNYLAHGDSVKLNKMISEFAAVKAASDDSYYGFAADMLNQMSTMTSSGIAELAQSGLTNAGQIQQMMKQGDVAQAGQMLSDSLVTALQNPALKSYLTNNGLADPQMISDAINNGNSQAFSESLGKAMTASGSGMISLDDKIAQNINGPFDKLSNWFTNLGPVAAVSDLFSNYNVTLANAANVAQVTSALSSSKRFTDLKDSFTNGMNNLSGKFGGVGTKITSSLSKLGGLFKSGFKSLSGSLLSGATKLGTSLLTKGGPAVSGLLAKGGATVAAAGGAAALGGVSAGLGLISSIKDLSHAIKGKDEKGNSLDSKGRQDKAFSGASKAGMVAAGAAIGSAIAPGIGTAVGAGVGGIVAMLAGSKVGQFLSNVFDLPIFKPIKTLVKGIGDVLKPLIKGIAWVVKTIGKVLMVPIKIIGGILGGALFSVFKALQKSVEIVLKPFQFIGEILSFVGKIFSSIGNFLKDTMNKIKAVFQPIVNIFTSLFASVKELFGVTKEGGDVLGSVFGFVGKVLGPVFKFLGNTLQVMIIKPLQFVGKVLEVLLTPLKWLAEGITKIADLFSGDKKSDVVASVDGSHRNGLTTVPRDNYVANLHKGEAVLPKNEANDWRSGNFAKSSITQASPLISINGNNSEVVSTLRWMMNRLERKLDELDGGGSGDTNNYYDQRSGGSRKSDEVFSF